MKASSAAITRSPAATQSAAPTTLLPSVSAALWVAAGDLVIAALLAFIASRSGRDPVAEEALMVRDAAMRQLSDGAARAAMLVPLMKSQSMKKGVIGAALTALAVGLFSRR